MYKYLNIIIILIFFYLIDDNNLYKKYFLNKIIFYLNYFLKKYNILNTVNKIKDFMGDIFLSSDEESESDSDISDCSDDIYHEELDKISAINGIFENVHTKNITAQNIYNNKIKTNNIAAKKGTYKNIDSINITAQNIYNKNIKSKSGNICNLKTKNLNIDDKLTSKNIETNNLESNNIKTQNFNIDNKLKSKNIETHNLDVILAKSKDLISENIKCTNFDLNDGNFNKLVGDQIDAKEINIISDRRKKKNIKYNPLSSDKLDDINVVSFEYKGETENHIGFIAQEIEELYPQLIKKDEHGYLSVKYLEMIPLLIDYNKNLKKKIIDIEEKINL